MDKCPSGLVKPNVFNIAIHNFDYVGFSQENYFNRVNEKCIKSAGGRPLNAMM